MDNSPFARLPPELRDHIYDAALQFPENVVLSKERDRGVAPDGKTSRIALNLLLTCRQIQEESVQRLYAVNTFSIVHNQGDASCEDILKQFVNGIGRTNAKALQSIRVSYTLTQGTIFSGQFRHHMKKVRQIALRIPDCAIKIDLSFFDIYKSILFQVQLDLQTLDTKSDKDSWIGKLKTSVASSVEESEEVQESMRFLKGHLRECRRDLERI